MHFHHIAQIRRQFNNATKQTKNTIQQFKYAKMKFNVWAASGEHDESLAGRHPGRVCPPRVTFSALQLTAMDETTTDSAEASSMPAVEGGALSDNIYGGGRGPRRE